VEGPGLRRGLELEAVDQDSDALGVYGRLINRNGATVGKDFLVNYAPVTGNQGYPGVQPLPGGGFVVAWQNDFSPTDEAVRNRRAKVRTVMAWPLAGSFR
jgi:hypothetical protein